MSLGEMMTLLKLRRGLYALVEEQVHSTSAVAGRTVADIDWPASCVVVAVLRGSQVITPRGPTPAAWRRGARRPPQRRNDCRRGAARPRTGRLMRVVSIVVEVVR